MLGLAEKVAPETYGFFSGIPSNWINFFTLVGGLAIGRIVAGTWLHRFKQGLQRFTNAPAEKTISS